MTEQYPPAGPSEPSPSDRSPADPPSDDGGSFFDRPETLSAETAAPTRVQTAPGRRRANRGPRLSGFLPVLIILAVVVVAGFVFVPRGIDKLHDVLNGSDPADYAGPGTGQVCLDVAPGETVTETGRALRDAGVVASVDAFVNAASNTSIRSGSYSLKTQMKASDAVEVLDGGSANGCATQFTIVSGHTEAETIALLAEATKFSAKQWTAAAEKTDQLGLPSYAQGNLEGYLTGGTFQVRKGDTPLSVLKQMVANFTKLADSVGLVDGAQRLGYTPEEIVIVASLIQKEVGKPADQAKVARVIYNRLENPGTAGTAGFLDLDSTINYATGKQGFDLGPEDLGVDSPYNTRTHAGLPPGAIDSPGKAALEAALNPAPGDWYYYVTVNPRTQETKFATTYDEFLADKAEFTQYCETSTAC